MQRHLAFIACGAWSLGASARTPAQPPTVLSRNVQRWETPFTAVAGVRELANGSILVSDASERSLSWLNPAGESRALGREGSGPGEYRAPGALFALAGDTTLLFDRLVRRFVVIAPGGALSTLSLPTGMRGWHEPLGVDETGALVFRAPRSDNGAPIVRWLRSQNRIDTIATLAAGRSVTARAGTMAVSREVPFALRDGAVATPALGIAVVRVQPFRIDVLTRGTWSHGATISYTPAPVSDDDVAAFIAANSPPAGTPVVRSDGRQSTAPAMKLTLENFGLTRADFPTEKPAFDPDGIIASVTGDVWIRLHAPAHERREIYELRRADGSRGARVALPNGRHLVAVGKERVYTVFTDANGETVRRGVCSIVVQ